tara:strand:- start:1442 stop:1642 length:201 start_codon:yes stop_codon:yes gene_type:complete
LLDALQEYLFDLRGYIIIPNALEPDLVANLNSALDSIDFWADWECKGGLRKGGSQIFEGGEPFENL